jgi:hypothetical protein
MRAELKRLHSPDVTDLHSWVPDDENFAILLQIIAGPMGADGEESFDVTLCSIAWLERRLSSERIIAGHQLLIVSEYDYDVLHGYITRYVSSCNGKTWRDVADKLARLGGWEFEDYRE